MKKVLRVSIVLMCLGLIGWFVKTNAYMLNDNRVDAVGALTVNLGVPNGSPIFTFPNIAPGFTTSKTITVHNGDSVSRMVGVKGVKTSGNKNLEQMLSIAVSDGSTPLYGGNNSKTLADFFNDSQTVNGVSLTSVSPNQTKTYTFVITFKESAGNEFQNANLSFDLTFGIVTSVPLACEGIRFDKTIFGTSGNDRLIGTTGNDLIVGLEGKDTIDGGLGNDCIVGGTNGGTLSGGLGNDVIVGSDAVDSIDGGLGDDLITAQGDNDTVKGGVDNDEIHGGQGNDNVDGGVGNDKTFGDAGNDTLLGGVGNDVLDGGVGTDSLNGGVGNDSCHGTTKIACESSF